MSSYSHNFFFYPERVDILIPDFQNLLCFCYELVQHIYFLLNYCTDTIRVNSENLLLFQNAATAFGTLVRIFIAYSAGFLQRKNLKQKIIQNFNVLDDFLMQLQNEPLNFLLLYLPLSMYMSKMIQDFLSLFLFVK